MHRSPHPICLNDVFPAWAQGSNGVISLLEAAGAVPWEVSESMGTLLDLEYHGNHSGSKIISPLIRQMLDEHGELPALAATNIASMCGKLFGESWKREWEVLSATYEPIENYSMTERMTDDETVIDYGHVHTNGGKLTHKKTGTESTATTDNQTETPNVTVTETPATTETVTHNTTVTDTPAITDTVTHNTTVTETPTTAKTTERSVYGFDTADNAPVKAETTTESYGSGGNTTTATTGTESTAKTGTDTTATTGTEATAMSGTNTTTTTGTRQMASIGSNMLTHNTTDEDTDSRTVTESGADTHTRNYTLTRSGNVGVTTSQQMLQSQIDLWKWNFFREVMFPNIDSVFTLLVY